MVTWQHALQVFCTICASFTVVCVAIGWVLKIVKGIKKPADDVAEKLDNDNKRLKTLEGQYRYIVSAIGVLMRCDLVILGHLQTDNDSGKMEKMEKELKDFLIDQASGQEAQVKVG